MDDKKSTPESSDESDEDIEPMEFETRFGSLAPWGGDYRVGDTNVHITVPEGAEVDPKEISTEWESRLKSKVLYFSLHGTNTGRLRSDQPNYGNSPQPYPDPDPKKGS